MPFFYDITNQKNTDSMYFVYALSSQNRNYIYVGLTSNLFSRIERHNKGYERTTKPYLPYQLIYFEMQPDRESARKREKYWKGGSGKRKLREIRERIAAGSLKK